jgi:uncharacterized membrane protein YhaH (DUF805 family)
MKVKWSDALKPEGRFSRSQFAFFYFVPILVSAVLGFLLGFIQPWSTGFTVAEFLGILAGWLIWPWLPFQVYLVIVAGVRRLHDLNRSGWYLLLAFVPLVNVVMILSLLFAPGKVEGNKWTTQLESEQ